MGMSTEKMQASFRLLMLITTPKLAEKALLLFEKGRLPMQIQAYAHGTASREMMDMLGLDSGEKSLLSDRGTNCTPFSNRAGCAGGSPGFRSGYSTPGILKSRWLYQNCSSMGSDHRG